MMRQMNVWAMPNFRRGERIDDDDEDEEEDEFEDLHSNTI